MSVYWGLNWCSSSIGMTLKHYTDTCTDVSAIWFINANLLYTTWCLVFENPMFCSVFPVSISSIFGSIFLKMFFNITKCPVYLDPVSMSMCMCWIPGKIMTPKNSLSASIHDFIVYMEVWGFYLWRLKVPDSFIHKWFVFFSVIMVN